jgi:AraC family transcriptional regulator of arabinose operon
MPVATLAGTASLPVSGPLPAGLPAGKVADKRIRKAIAAVEHAANGRHPSVSDLARSVGLSLSQFAHLFKQCTGASPLKFLKHAKLKHAALLLKTTDMLVKEVAWATGFRDVSHFVRRFEDAVGLSPQKYRSRLLGK